MKVIIFGINRTTLLITKYLRENHEVIGISDNIANINFYGKYPFIKPDKIATLEYDYIIISNENKNVCESIKKGLLKENVLSEKIVFFHEMFYEERVHQIMIKAQLQQKKYDGCVIGISHAEHGINVDLLDGNWCNLAVSSSDIYYDYKTIQIMKNNYCEMLEKLKYVIIDLWDYTVLDYDTSLGQGIINYWGWGGITEEQHNFDKNINYQCSDVERMLVEAGKFSSCYARKNRILRKKLFNELSVIEDYECGKLHTAVPNMYQDSYNTNVYTRHMSETPDLRFNLFYSDRICENTRKENIAILNKLISEIKDINPNMVIKFVLIPRYYKLEMYHEKLLVEYKKFFDKEIGQICNREKIELLNYKNCTQISKNNYFYYDPAHLNHSGAIAFTSILNRDFFKIVK